MNTIIETDRLLLTDWNHNDLQPFARICADPVVMEYFPQTLDTAQSQTLLDKINAHYSEHGYTLYATRLKKNQELIGFVGLLQPTFEIPHFIPLGSPTVEIGWRLAKDHWGQGYAPEAAQAVLKYGFQQLVLPEVISFTAKTNLPSQRVMQKIGLKYDQQDDFMHPTLPNDHQLCHHVLYRLSHAAYNSRTSSLLN